jgi:hypothetical protein
MTATSIPLLQQRARNRWEVAERGDEHRSDAERHSGDHALAGYRHRALADPDRVGDAVDAADGDDGVGGLA